MPMFSTGTRDLGKETMVKNHTTVRVYTVVEVMAGVAVGAYVFTQIKAARACARQLQKERDLLEDDVQIFEGAIGSLKEPSLVFA